MNGEVEVGANKAPKEKWAGDKKKVKRKLGGGAK